MRLVLFSYVISYVCKLPFAALLNVGFELLSLTERFKQIVSVRIRYRYIKLPDATLLLPVLPICGFQF